MLSFLIDFCFKGFLYALPPLIFAIRRKDPITKKSIALHIALINGTIYVLSVVLALPNFNLAGVPIPFLWSAITYGSLQGIFRANELLINGSSAAVDGGKEKSAIGDIPVEEFENCQQEGAAVLDQPSPVFDIRPPARPQAEEVSPPAPSVRQKPANFIPLVSCIAAVISVLSCVILASAYFSSQSRISDLEQRLSSATQRIIALEGESVRQETSINILDDRIDEIGDTLRKDGYSISTHGTLIPID